MAINSDFNFETFAASMLSSIDGFRSFGRHGKNSFTESRVDAFFRAIGLPAVLIDRSVERAEGKTIIDKFNTDNRVDLTLTDQQKQFMQSRQTRASTPISDAEINATFDFSSSKVASSVEENLADQRIRGVIIPMVVNGDVEIWPQSKRVAGAFMSDDERTHDKIIYKRPLLELLIRLRLKKEGAFDTNQAALAEELSQMGQDIIDSIDMALDGFGAIAKVAVKRINQVRKDTGADIRVTPDSVPNSKKTVVTNADKQGDLDKQLANARVQLAKRNARAFVFESGGAFVDTAFSSHIMGSISGDEGRLQKDIENIEDRLSKKTKALKVSHRDIDYLFGTFSGISVTDILSIIVVLLKIPMKDLVFLLNEDARTRLSNELGVSQIPSDTGPVSILSGYDTSSAISTLENNVKEALSLVDEEIIKRIPIEQSINRKPKKKE